MCCMPYQNDQLAVICSRWNEELVLRQGMLHARVVFTLLAGMF